ncbi:methylated-DNA--[protein]-cysteine S-methyltransferase [Streptomyces sp. PT12]|uniref:methylated-DNA--[protein]-cysteine S-methyltransferase n=1 Tax=Streptomyces sp. PT12 TaxID=1510197 RepID=UPI000DE3AE05|nr:methylated-DNA--[protein]-cysteine S-methyltransferase [Streptomyces sp. PT12]RBM20751.1 cysteine methyltransferase [Streptomyces sp. PT12]
MLYTTHPSPVGDLLIAGPAPDALAWLTLSGQKYAPAVGPDWARDDAAFRPVAEQFDAYFAGELTAFDIGFAPGGTPFRRRVWAAIDRIPYGTTVTYAQLTEQAGLEPRMARAVGGAVGHNPLSIVRPCHRVVGTNGSLTGYAGGLDRKRHLLTLEGVLLAA